MKRTLTNLWNGYFRAKIFVNLSPSADRLFLGVLNKANEMGFPDTFSMANSEAMANGNIKSEPTLYNRRNELADYTFMNEWLLRYEKGEVDHCGEYEINYDLLLKYSQVFLNNANGDSQNLGKNESELPSGSKNLGKNESRPEVDSQNLVNNESENGFIQENDSQNLGKNEYINRSDQKRIDKNNRSLQKISFNSKKSEEEKKRISFRAARNGFSQRKI